MIKKQIDKWKSKSVGSKLSDVLFLVIVLTLVIPDGRLLFRKALLKTGIFNGQMEFVENGDKIGNEAQNIVFVDREGVRHDLSEFSNQVQFVNFWATWCPPCRAEFESIVTLYEKSKTDPNIAFFLLTFEDFSTVDKFLMKQGISQDIPVYQMISEYKGKVFTGNLPSTAVIDKNGSIAFQIVGMLDYADEGFYEQLTALGAK